MNKNMGSSKDLLKVQTNRKQENSHSLVFGKQRVLQALIKCKDVFSACSKVLPHTLEGTRAGLYCENSTQGWKRQVGSSSQVICTCRDHSNERTLLRSRCLLDGVTELEWCFLIHSNRFMFFLHAESRQLYTNDLNHQIFKCMLSFKWPQNPTEIDDLYFQRG